MNSFLTLAVCMASTSLACAASLTRCLGAFCGMTRQSQMMKTTPSERETAVSQRGSPMRRCRQLTHSDHDLREDRRRKEWRRDSSTPSHVWGDMLSGCTYIHSILQ